MKLSIEHREQIIERARQLISNQPSWGRRAINRQLRAELGHGLRSSDIDKLTAPTREARKAGAPQLPPTDRITSARQRRTLQQAGFLPFEIGTLRTTRGGFAFEEKRLGAIPADADHPRLRQVLGRMIMQRHAERQRFEKQAHKRGWSKAKTNAVWRRRILTHYRKGSFPTVGGPTKRGKFMAADGSGPSPWALFNAWLDYLIKIDPFGGLGIGDTPKPARGGGRIAPTRPVSRATVRKHIRENEEQVRQLEASIAHQRAAGNYGMVQQHIRQRQAKLDTLSELRSKL